MPASNGYDDASSSRRGPNPGSPPPIGVHVRVASSAVAQCLRCHTTARPSPPNTPSMGSGRKLSPPCLLALTADDLLGLRPARFAIAFVWSVTSGRAGHGQHATRSRGRPLCAEETRRAGQKPLTSLSAVFRALTRLHPVSGTAMFFFFPPPLAPLTDGPTANAFTLARSAPPHDPRRHGLPSELPLCL
jgi:hypothetical protein